MIIGTHVLIYAEDANKARAFFRDVLGFSHVNAGHDWLIFQLPPAEVGFHPTEGEPQHHVMYLMCDDIKRTIADLEAKGVKCSPTYEAEWGILTQFEVPGAGTFGVYQPKHPLAIDGKKGKAKGKGKGKPRIAPKPKAKAKRKR